MKYGIRVGLLVTSTGSLDPGDLEAHLDEVIEAFSKMEDCHQQLLDGSFGLDEADGSVDVEMTVQATKLEEAMEIAMSCLRAAIHDAGGSTPGWDDAPHADHAVAYAIDEEGASVRVLSAA